MAVAALSMYTEPVAVTEAYDELVRLVAARLAVELEVVPDDLPTLWRHPQLLLAQTCGYPWVTQLQGKVRLVAAPQYVLPGCNDATHCSFILVSESSTFANLSDLRGRSVAINGQDSNSGMNLLRDAVAPLSEQGRFFGKIIETGSHVNSMKALQEGKADVAAVDAVTYGYLKRDVPERVAGLRVLQQTRQSPALPLICSVTHSDEMVRNMQAALSAVLSEQPDLAEMLAIQGFAEVSEETYLPILQWKEEAIRLGYPVVA